MKWHIELTNRDKQVLTALIRQFIANGLPVGSKALAAQVPMQVSSATIRSVLGSLEEYGFLTQPHISAGRVPTEKAYRFYVDSVASGSRLSPDTERYIDRSLSSGQHGLERLMVNASRTLSEVSRNVGLVLAPALEEKLLEHVKFVNLPDHRVLVVNKDLTSQASRNVLLESHWRGLWLASVFIGHQAAFALASQSPRQWHQVAPGGAFLLVPKLPLGHARPRSFRFASAACSACRRGEAGASGSCAPKRSLGPRSSKALASQSPRQRHPNTTDLR